MISKLFIQFLWGIIYLTSLINSFFYADQPYLYTRSLSNAPIKLKENERIIVYSPFRTGSTLVYNILNYLCEDQTVNSSARLSKRVIKAHHPQHERYFKLIKDHGHFGYVFVTIRNPVEAALSYCNLMDICERGKALEAINLIKRQYELLKEFTLQHEGHLGVTVLRYEECNDHLEIILGEIERVFSCKISTEDRKEILRLFNRERMKGISDSLGSWKSFDPETELRGGHVDKMRNRYIKSPAFQNILFDRLESVLSLWNYSSKLL